MKKNTNMLETEVLSAHGILCRPAEEKETADKTGKRKMIVKVRHPQTAVPAFLIKNRRKNMCKNHLKNVFAIARNRVLMTIASVLDAKKRDGYLESPDGAVSWCRAIWLNAMPEAYDENHRNGHGTFLSFPTRKLIVQSDKATV